ncbi:MULTISPECIES: 3-isopropylmalate dehydratase small subunit [Nocardiopsis]|uniref:3-isopropylmalate dehydratase small subunit n=1 Tax=Nocardiopsis sinuspersici TaxID=501010 RepID=A0A1V3C681_9ACTN|nr:MULTISPECIES: 3-isopropylmalate dehydratase small subunit [Nocardiopsis]OOC56142.1 3-isopropylmalate dehydratase small subunit [Nocardiopsis sinuspersici]
MQKFITHVGTAVPLERSDVNTDDIIPARFLKSIRRTGFGEHLFANWRYTGGGRELNPEFVLNKPEYKDASILVSNDNFGCGSSREHAPWALREYGFVCIIASSFADIFYNNCFNSNILPIVLASSEVGELLGSIAPGPVKLSVDLPAQTVTTSDGREYRFEIDAFHKYVAMEGLDNVSWSLSHMEDILAYEDSRRQEAPWLFP